MAGAFDDMQPATLDALMQCDAERGGVMRSLRPQRIKDGTSSVVMRSRTSVI